MKVKDLLNVVKDHIILVDAYEDDAYIIDGHIYTIPKEYYEDVVRTIYARNAIDDLGVGLYIIISIFNHNSIL